MSHYRYPAHMCKYYVHVNHRSSEISKNLVKSQINKERYLCAKQLNQKYQSKRKIRTLSLKEKMSKSESEQTALKDILAKITNGREKDHKPPVNNYYICNTDEPYAEVIRGIIMGGEAVKANNLNEK